MATRRSARLDADRTAAPQTRLVGHARPGDRVGPGLSQADALEDTTTGKRTLLSGPFINSRYEYSTREIPFSIEACSFRSEHELAMAIQGWTRAWADVTAEGIFIVYRRSRAADKRPEV